MPKLPPWELKDTVRPIWHVPQGVAGPWASTVPVSSTKVMIPSVGHCKQAGI